MGTVLLLLASAALALIPAAVAAVRSATASSQCAWPLRFGVDTTNAYLPDTAATYWSMPYLVSSDLQITIAGSFPDARYMSFNVYDSETGSFTSNGVDSSLSDYEIAPDEASTNPWQTSADPGGKFTVTLRTDPAGQVNTLPIAPSGTADWTKGSVIFRYYLPTEGAEIALPTITVTRNGVSTTLENCASARTTGTDESPPTDESQTPTSDPAPTTPTPSSSASPGVDNRNWLEFARTSELESMAPNADNGYLSTWIPPLGDDEVALIRAKAPRSAGGTHPTPWPVRGVSLRYWSMCNNLEEPNNPVVVNTQADGTVDYGCRYDDNTSVDRVGYYTYVIGTEAQRATIEAIRDATFLPFSFDQPDAAHMVVLRNLLPADTFRFAIQRVTMDSGPGAAEAVMGAYYPRVSICSLTGLTGNDPAACSSGG
jgi:hypothetical protein